MLVLAGSPIFLGMLLADLWLKAFTALAELECQHALAWLLTPSCAVAMPSTLDCRKVPGCSFQLQALFAHKVISSVFCQP